MTTPRRSKTPGTFLWIYGAPLWLGALGLIGLAAALFADGIWDWISWLALGVMTLTGLWYALVPMRAKPPARGSDAPAVPPAALSSSRSSPRPSRPADPSPR